MTIIRQLILVLLSLCAATAFHLPSSHNKLHHSFQQHFSSKESEVATSTTKNSTSSSSISVQESIISSSLGIEPESPLQRSERIAKRLSKEKQLQKRRNTNFAVAIVSFLLAIFNYFYQYTHPITSLQILSDLQNSSPSLSVIGHNNKPTVVDFWAPWCENCKLSAPTLKSIHDQYQDEVNFILLNADIDSNWPAIQKFGVDAIPHMAFIDKEGEVQTALIGVISSKAVKEDLNVLLDDEKKELPVQMYDAFKYREKDRKVSF